MCKHTQTNSTTCKMQHASKENVLKIPILPNENIEQSKFNLLITRPFKGPNSAFSHKAVYLLSIDPCIVSEVFIPLLEYDSFSDVPESRVWFASQKNDAL